MSPQKIGILSPGDMGGAVGRELARNGLDVFTCVTGRSPRTRQTAQDGGFHDLPDLAALAGECDLILSILVPAEATAMAGSVAAAIRSSGHETAYADCNAVAPQTSRAMAETIERAGGRFIDAGIIGGPPRADYAPTFYASGPYAGALAALDGRGIRVIDMAGEPGRASAVKMTYAALTKGTAALRTALLVAAHRLGVYDPLCTELQASQSAVFQQMENSMRRLPTVAHRWIGELEEIAATFDAAGEDTAELDLAGAIAALARNAP
jgi:3-hydroxyisobutyrate dehydrogenase-like beta-hydroxyacid dehydrogenase